MKRLITAMAFVIAGRFILKSQFMRILFLLMILLSLAACKPRDFSYATNDGAVAIVRYTGSGGAVNIPNTIHGLPVTSVEHGAFAGCDSVTSATIPASVTSIGDYVFSACSNLTTITVDRFNPVCSSVDGVLFNKSQTMLMQCPGGKTGNVTILKGVTSIGLYAFDDCGRLTSITVDSSNSAFCSIEGVLFSKDHKVLLQCPEGKEGSFTIPNGVTSVDHRAFSACSKLTSVIIPAGVTSIGGHTFEGCSSMTNIVIGSSVANIGGEAFSYCTSLTKVMIPSCVTNIGDYAFLSSSNLLEVYFLGDAPSLGECIFSYADYVAVFYSPETRGWSTSFGGRPASLKYLTKAQKSLKAARPQRK